MSSDCGKDLFFHLSMSKWQGVFCPSYFSNPLLSTLPRIMVGAAMVFSPPRMQHLTQHVVVGTERGCHPHDAETGVPPSPFVSVQTQTLLKMLG